MAKKSTSNTPEKENLHQQTKKHGDNVYTHEIADAFSKKMETNDKKYFSWSKEQIVQDFEKFVEQEYGNHILQALKDGKITGEPLDIEMNAIVDKWFTLSDFFDTKKWEVIQNNFSRTVKEQDAMEQWLLELYREWDNLPNTTKNKLKFDDFIHVQGYRKITDPSGKVRSITPWHNPISHNVQTLQTAWKEYVRGVTNDTDERNDYSALLDFKHFDPTEKIVAVSAVRELYENITRKTKWQQRQDLLALADSIFDQKNPIPSDTTWTTMIGLSVAMKDFFQQAGSLADADQLKSLQNMRLTLKDCVKNAEDNKLLAEWTLDKQLLNRKYSDLNRQFQNMANSFVQADLINNIDEIVDEVDEEIDEYAKIFDVPGNMAKFFEQFWTPSQLTNTYTDQNYIKLKRKEHELRELLAKSGLSQSDKETYKAELVQVQGQINKHKSTQQVFTWDDYFDHIANQIDTANIQTGVSILWTDVKSILQTLRDNNWDIATLWSAQNTLMKASIALQLLKVKDKHSFQTLWYSFQSYAQFVSSLYDLESKQTMILTQDHVPITLNFTSKKFVGKPLEFHNIDVSDISSLSNIRVEFELDLTDNQNAENFIRTMTGGPNSQLVQDFFPEKSGFPDTMTDSSFVEMVDKDGVRYEWYLSPTDFVMTDQTDGIYGNDPQTAAKTFILYSKPADQLHVNRDFVTQEDDSNQKILTESGKEKPVYINISNLQDWKSIEIKDKKVTLSDWQLKALTLGHMVAQSLNADQLLDHTNQSVQQIIAQQDDTVAKELQENTRDLWSESPEQAEALHEWLSTDQEFNQSWKSLLWWDHPCEVGSRIAVKFPKSIDGKKTIRTFPDSEQLLSMMVKDLKKDEHGKVIGATFWFDTLSRVGTCTLKDITLTGKQLDKINDVFWWWATYIDNIKKDPQDYKTVLWRLENAFSDWVRKKSYAWDVLKPLDFNGKEFLKDDKKVTTFVSTQKTANADDKTNKAVFDVEYQIESVWSNKYRITSTPYQSEMADKDGKSKTANIAFDTTTDLAGMLLILSTKKLVPFNEQEYVDYKKKDGLSSDTVPQVKRKWHSLSTWRSVLSGKGKDIIDGIKKKFKENEEESLKYALFTEWRLMRRVANGWLWKVLDGFDLNVLNEMAWEIEIEWQNFWWKKIEGVFKFLDSFHAANNAYGPPGMWMVEGIVTWAVQKYNSWSLGMKDRRKVAGALLYSIDKMKSWYAKNLSKYPAGTYVKILFGEQYYHHYMRHYKNLELEAKENSDAGRAAQERLNMLEYNFIVANVRGGDVLEKNEPYVVQDSTNPIFYFQNLYSRKFGNELWNRLWELKSFEVNSKSKDVKDLIDTNNFDHVYNECRDHMFDVRVKDCLNELIALQYMAKDAEQADKVSQLFMSGILSGVFVNNLSKSNKTDLKKLMFQAGIPYAGLIEKYDGPAKIQKLLILATGTTSGDFSHFTYGNNKNSYNPNDFKSSVGNQDKKWLILSFEQWFKDHRDQIIPFLHMDPDNMKTKDNMIRIWKSKESDIEVFGKKVDPDTKKLVDDVMKDFYYNTGWRQITLDDLNYGSDLVHTASMIEQTFPVINQYEEGKRKNDNKDHAELLWSNITKNVPSGKETFDNRYLLAHNINNFFRYFDGIGDIHYSRWAIELFYRNMRLAQEQTNPKDRTRLIWFYLTDLLYGKGRVPKEVDEWAFKKYMEYFETNLDNFDAKLWKEHTIPSGEGDFEDVFTDSGAGITYIPEKKWREITIQWQQNQYSKWARANDTTLLNLKMTKDNETKRIWGGNLYGNNFSRSIGKSVDDKIEELRTWKISTISSEKELIRTNPIDTNNRNNIDLDSIVTPQKSPTPIFLNKKKWWKDNASSYDDVLENLRDDLWIAA